MSHIVTIQTEVRDLAAIASTCSRLGLPASQHGSHRLFSGQVQGHAVQLPEWKYPLVCQVESGELRYDNYGGRWGAQSHLDRFLQIYAVERAKIEARKSGHTCTEQQRADGSIKLTVNVGGAA